MILGEVGLRFIVCIVGRSNSGKTTLLENLVGELKQRGYSLATIKHAIPDFDLDRPGKDSWRLAQAGSDTVVLSSPQRVALIRRTDHEASLDELLCLLSGELDFVLAEGFKNSSLPKIEVHRKDVGDLMSSEEELLAVVSDEPLDVAVPQFSPDDVGPLVDLLERRSRAQHEDDETLILVNDTPLPLDPVTKTMINKTLLGIASALKGDEDVRSLRISLRRGRV